MVAPSAATGPTPTPVASTPAERALTSLPATPPSTTTTPATSAQVTPETPPTPTTITLPAPADTDAVVAPVTTALPSPPEVGEEVVVVKEEGGRDKGGALEPGQTTIGEVSCMPAHQTNECWSATSVSMLQDMAVRVGPAIKNPSQWLVMCQNKDWVRKEGSNWFANRMVKIAHDVYGRNQPDDAAYALATLLKTVYVDANNPIRADTMMRVEKIKPTTADDCTNTNNKHQAQILSPAWPQRRENFCLL